MSLVHSNENIPEMIEINAVKQCSVCKKDFELDENLVSTHCGHVFHRACIMQVLEETNACPICYKLCRQTTLRTYNFSAEVEASGSVHQSPKNNNENSTGAIPKAPKKKNKRNANNGNANLNNNMPRTLGFSTQNQTQLSAENLINLSQRNQSPQYNISDESLQCLIEEAVSRQLALTNISQPNNRDSIGTSHFNANRNAPFRQNFARSDNRSLQLNTDKISNIISGWHILFSGVEEESISVDDFIYRVNALTNQSLRGDFDILCRHAHLLFKDKALHWYWRYHKTTPSLNWNSLCQELSNQFRDRRSDYDYLDQLRSRKQKPGERFDTFYDAILKITDRLQSPIHESEMVEIIKRNLRPEVRKGLLHFYISSVSKLREFVRKYEILDDEINYGSKPNRHMLPRRNISELEAKVVNEDENIQLEEIKELTCWNCSEVGHKYDECMGDRTVFCYGCGAPNTYKPNCQKCSKFSKNCQNPYRGKHNSQNRN